MPAAFEGPGKCFGEADGGAAEIDLTPLTNSNCLRHLAMATSNRPDVQFLYKAVERGSFTNFDQFVFVSELFPSLCRAAFRALGRRRV